MNFQKYFVTTFFSICLAFVAAGESRADPLTQAEKNQLRPPTDRNLPRLNSVSAKKRIGLTPKYKVKKPKTIRPSQHAEANHLVIKFVDGSRVRATNPRDWNENSSDIKLNRERLNGLISDTRKMNAYDRHLLKQSGLKLRDVKAQLKQVRQLLQSQDIEHWGRKFKGGERRLERIRLKTELTFQRQSSDLSNYYWVKLAKGSNTIQVANALNQFGIIEEVHLQPIFRDADIPPVTPDLSPQQGYLTAAPTGIGVQNLWGTVAGARGENVAVIDIERDWQTNHEEFLAMSPVDGRIDGGDDANHGTAAMSVMVAQNDNAGVIGIIHQARGGVVSFRRDLASTYYMNMADAIMFAANNLRVGDIILLEQQVGTFLLSNATCACGSSSSDCGLVPVEYFQVIFDAISAATAMGVIVVEPAGNGFQDLDKPRYDGRFDRNVRNSGAIMVGASHSGNDRRARCFSNTGSRLDLHGWGRGVMAAGYGESGGNVDPTLRFGSDPADRRQWYRSDYSGTSSASPIVAGAIGVIQSVLVERGYRPMDYVEITNLLTATGTPQTPGDDINRSSGRIGPLPDLEQAIASLDNSHPVLTEEEQDDLANQETVLNAARTTVPSVAGISGTRTATAGYNDGEFAALARVEYGEKSDRPCFLNVQRAHLGNKTPFGSEARVDICGSGGVSPRSRRSVPDLRMVAGATWDSFLTGIQVCNSNSRNNFHRMKGVRGYYSKLRDDGSLEPAIMKENHSARCNQSWGSIVRCPSNSVATGIVAQQTRDKGSTYAISGLQLICQELGRE